MTAGRITDAMAFVVCAEHGQEFDAIHASPPCQAYSQMNNIHKASDKHPDLIANTRSELLLTYKPFVIENVYKSPLRAHFMLCGTMFSLRIIRHRYFECDWLPLLLMPPCNHTNIYDPWHGVGRTADKMQNAMGINWMPMGGGGHKTGSIDEAIPPVYTEFIGKFLIREI